MKSDFGYGNRLTDKQKKYILINYKKMLYKDIAKELGCTEGTVYNVVKKCGFSKRKYLSDFNIDHIANFSEPYSGKLHMSELRDEYFRATGIDVPIDTFKRIVKRTNFVPYRDTNRTRWFLNGNKKDLHFDNITLISDRVMRRLRKHNTHKTTDRETTKAAIEVENLISLIVDKKILYVATNLKTGQVKTFESASSLNRGLHCRDQAWRKRKTREDGSKNIKGWNVRKVVDHLANKN